jgi:hypothetical protein
MSRSRARPRPWSPVLLPHELNQFDGGRVYDDGRVFPAVVFDPDHCAVEIRAGQDIGATGVVGVKRRQITGKPSLVDKAAFRLPGVDHVLAAALVADTKTDKAVRVISEANGCARHEGDRSATPTGKRRNLVLPTSVGPSLEIAPIAPGES